MATYQLKKCPKCGTVYERNSYAGNPSKDNRTKYGSPLKMCPSCKVTFVDEEYREIAIEGVRDVDTQYVSPASVVFTMFGAMMFFMSFISTGKAFGVLFLIPGVYFLCDDLSSYKKRKKAFEILKLESEIRLLRPAYAVLLKQHGYNVPNEYLFPSSVDANQALRREKQLLLIEKRRALLKKPIPESVTQRCVQLAGNQESLYSYIKEYQDQHIISPEQANYLWEVYKEVL